MGVGVEKKMIKQPKIKIQQPNRNTMLMNSRSRAKNNHHPVGIRIIGAIVGAGSCWP
jgi:hypothetical protein